MLNIRTLVRSKLHSFQEFLVTLVLRRYLISQMAAREISSHYFGSSLGLVWAFIKPAVTILILWVVFSLGFKVSPSAEMPGVPFVVWLIAALAIWTPFAEILLSSTGIIQSHSHLVKKTVFPLSILPVVRVVASLVTHGIFLLLLIIFVILNDLPLTLYWLQAPYYLFAMATLALGLSWLTASMTVFLKDVGQITEVALQMGFWITPIFWHLEMMPESLRPYLQLNPMFYVVQGYRESFLAEVPFWQHPGLTIYFWTFTCITFVVGALVFQRLKPHFADLL